MTTPKPVLGLTKSRAKTAMVRIGAEAHERLRAIAEQEQTSQRALLEYAIDLLDRDLYFKRVKAGYAAMTPEERTSEPTE